MASAFSVFVDLVGIYTPPSVVHFRVHIKLLPLKNNATSNPGVGVKEQATQQQPRRRFSLVRCVATCFIALIVLVGLAVLIAWLVVNPKKFVYTLESGSVQNFNLTNNHLNATFDFVLRAHNPNRRLSVYYDHIESTVIYEDQTIAFNTVDPFFQPHRNVSRVKSKLMALNLAMSLSTSKDLMIEKTSREIQVDVHFKTRIRVKVGIWKSNHRTLRIVCYSVMVHLTRYKHFNKVPCETEL
ncbi:uncharacterized protein At1g08160-like [Hibiscus syriacus]|uniref:uncharacterized protein At1g08160-like n=1 Tax=Hibiscus syriacus TaxID=106335 RepID=UPI00192134A9|nr:uncharacterized protein At1g08160-like [Hibiscus syriacus]